MSMPTTALLQAPETPAPAETPDFGPPRTRVLAAVEQNPGVHFRGLARATGFSQGQLRYHVDVLRRNGLLVEVRDGGYTRFFVAGRHEPSLRPALAVLQRPLGRRIAELLQEQPLQRCDLRWQLGCADSTLSFHLGCLLQAGIVVKHWAHGASRYALADPALVQRALELLPAEPAQATAKLARPSAAALGFAALEAPPLAAAGASGWPPAD